MDAAAVESLTQEELDAVAKWTEYEFDDFYDEEE